MKHNFLLSVIVPVFNEEESVLPFLKEILPILKQYNHEILFVDDGSKDKTVAILKEQAVIYPSIKILSFVRNFGHQVALTAGYQHVSGDCVITMDVDLQDPPHLIPELVQEWKKGNKIVYAKRQTRNESFFKIATARFFYWLINFLSESPVPNDVGDYRLLDKDVVQTLNQFPERSRFLRGLVAWGGYPSTSVLFTRNERKFGTTHYPFLKMFNFALDGITSFSTKPLKIATFLGFILCIFAVISGFYALYVRFFLPHEYWVTGWTALFSAIVFFGGMQLLTIGIIGEYIGKIYKQVQNRPLFIIKEKIHT
jgi:dolichol-phosphate mannosyltransferase